MLKQVCMESLFGSEQGMKAAKAYLSTYRAMGMRYRNEVHVGLVHAYVEYFIRVLKIQDAKYRKHLQDGGYEQLIGVITSLRRDDAGFVVKVVHSVQRLREYPHTQIRLLVDDLLAQVELEHAQPMPPTLPEQDGVETQPAMSPIEVEEETAAAMPIDPAVYETKPVARVRSQKE